MHGGELPGVNILGRLLGVRRSSGGNDGSVEAA
jgi:hypothetical protein